MGAAFGLVQLDRLDGNIAVRERNFERQLAFFAEYEDWFILPRQLPDTRTGWLAFPLIVRDDAPFGRRDLQVSPRAPEHPDAHRLHRQHPAPAGLRRDRAARGAGRLSECRRVMRGGMLLACHHGLSDRQLDYVHEQFRAFAASY